MSVAYEDTQYGFRWGSLTVTRYFDDAGKGYVCVGLTTKRYALDVYAMKGGKVRLFVARVRQGRVGTKVEVRLDDYLG